MSYLTDAFQPHLRLTLLRVLAEAPGYCTNSSILHQAVNSMGLRASRDQVAAELAWLAEQRAIETAEPAIGLIVATLTNRGHDVQSGCSTLPGVQKPSPGR
ncbi:VpaChn25_0724 family phage protein [Sphingomonas sp. TX0522]|uniref:VpaChn25_0724 family phage protein n=1 Tax=Sphingomonas sp. TX0522 TaxID=2479205 RepID=UPI0018E04B68|nr:hypothetical protein [Sphingomonas sp. TX0522]MBI0530079.1 ArsR family transcriptional regulator [Sphingomonas sp. TX0522]